MKPRNEPFEPDDAALRDARWARSGAIAGVVSIVLAPIIVGFLAGAIGLHAARLHLRERIGHRGLAWFGIVTSLVGALGSAIAAVVWGMIMMTVMLQHSALRQAEQWRNAPAPAWALVDVSGARHDSETAKGRVVLFDVCSPRSPYCAATTRALSDFAAKHSDVIALSWCPECDDDEARRFATECATVQPMCAGSQSMTGVFEQIAAKPTLLVIDGKGVIRAVVLGRYGAAELQQLVDEAR